MKYLIFDKTANTGACYINEFGENCELEENSMLFDSETEANEHININNWENWAIVIEATEPNFHYLLTDQEETTYKGYNITKSFDTDKNLDFWTVEGSEIKFYVPEDVFIYVDGLKIAEEQK